MGLSSSHKYQAILTTVFKIPFTITHSHSLSNVMKGFILISQLDEQLILVPSLGNVLHTYWGDARGTFLNNKRMIMEKFYAPIYNNGIIPED